MRCCKMADMNKKTFPHTHIPSCLTVVTRRDTYNMAALVKGMHHIKTYDPTFMVRSCENLEKSDSSVRR